MTHAELQAKIAEQQLGNAKLTDIKLGTYSLVLPVKETDSIFLVGAKNAKYPISLRGLAAMRIVTAADKITVKTTREARNHENFSNLQDAIVNDKLPISDTTKFNVVGQLRVVGVDEVPVYKNEHYKNYADYVKETRKIARLPLATQAERDIRNAAFTEASETLRAGGVNTGAKAPKDVDESYIMMPVFTVTN